MPKVVIVIPTQKNSFNVFETIALRQLQKILPDYPKIFLLPDTADIKFLDNWDGFWQKKMSDSFFSSIESYNRLCLSESLYECFADYDYMLIYQTDAFVFSDRLEEFCDMGYDYIGAPVPFHHWPKHYPMRVGNGGFSLRKISSALRVLRHKGEVFEEANINGVLLSCEDMFWGFASTMPELNFITPDTDIAADFSTEYDFMGSYAKLNDRLPFGCHCWYRENFSHWWPIIMKYGYSAETGDIFDYTSNGVKVENAKKIKSIIKEEQYAPTKLKNIMPQILDTEKKYILWGYGQVGSIFETLLRLGGLNIVAVWDKKLAGQTTADGMKITKPMTDNEKDGNDRVIIVAVLRDEQEICRQLKQKGLKNGQDFLRSSNLNGLIAEKYYRNK